MSLPLSVPLFVGCIESEANMLVFGPFFDPVLAEQEAGGGGGKRCPNAHLIGRTVGPHTAVRAPSPWILKAALDGEHGAAVIVWHLERSKQTPEYRLVHATDPKETP